MITEIVLFKLPAGMSREEYFSDALRVRADLGREDPGADPQELSVRRRGGARRRRVPVALGRRGAEVARRGLQAAHQRAVRQRADVHVLRDAGRGGQRGARYRRRLSAPPCRPFAPSTSAACCAPRRCSTRATLRRRSMRMPLRALEDEHVAEAIRWQESIGLQSITDGEFRRESWRLDSCPRWRGCARRRGRRRRRPARRCRERSKDRVGAVRGRGVGQVTGGFQCDSASPVESSVPNGC